MDDDEGRLRTTAWKREESQEGEIPGTPDHAEDERPEDQGNYLEDGTSVKDPWLHCGEDLSSDIIWCSSIHTGLRIHLICTLLDSTEKAFAPWHAKRATSASTSPATMGK